jgi:hypothetical protein
VSPLRYELDFHIPEDGILHSHCHENIKSYKQKYYVITIFSECKLNCNLYAYLSIADLEFNFIIYL